MKWNPFNTRIGLALGGGAAKGIAHIGVLKAFEEESIAISCISGTSSGALVASYFAFGKPVEEIKSIGETLNLSKIVNFTWKKRGLFSTDAIRQMICRDLGDVNIEDARIPLAICTTDVETGEQIIFKTGNLADAVCASMAVPGLFVPVEINGRTLVDGGLVENVPVSLLESMGAGITVAVDLSHCDRYPTPKDTLDVVNNAINIGMDLRTKEQLQKADIVVNLNLMNYSRTNNSDHIEELCMEGYLPMKRQIKEVLWYKRTNAWHYLVKVVLQLIPLKIPRVIHERIESAAKTIDTRRQS
jgi:NTE family protein